ncbi:MAG: hypothetical protein HY657_14415 [Acidobacteria bacterium]|nr:hypothetical protein [Acidobacteriota bacterium]
MATINTRGVILGGLAAGLVINVSEYVLNEPVLGAQIAAAMSDHNLAPIGGGAIAVFLLYGFALGIALVWLYAAIRPRFGAGPKTAAVAGLVAWFLAYFTASLNMGVIGLLPAPPLLVGLIWGLAELILAAVVGARVYTEAPVLT